MAQPELLPHCSRTGALLLAGCGGLSHLEPCLPCRVVSCHCVAWGGLPFGWLPRSLCCPLAKVLRPSAQPCCSLPVGLEVVGASAWPKARCAHVREVAAHLSLLIAPENTFIPIKPRRWDPSWCNGTSRSKFLLHFSISTARNPSSLTFERGFPIVLPEQSSLHVVLTSSNESPRALKQSLCTLTGRGAGPQRAVTGPGHL